MITYYIESLVNGKGKPAEIYAYYKRGELKYAKQDLVMKFKSDMAQIVCLIGQYYGEGRHAYYMTYSGTSHHDIKFKKNKKNQLKF